MVARSLSAPSTLFVGGLPATSHQSVSRGEDPGVCEHRPFELTANISSCNKAIGVFPPGFLVLGGVQFCSVQSFRTVFSAAVIHAQGSWRESSFDTKTLRVSVAFVALVDMVNPPAQRNSSVMR